MKRIRNLFSKKSVVIFYLSGILAFIWFLVRVIPKPYRATYPCQRAAFPLATGFIFHITGLIVGSLLYKKGIRIVKQKRLTGILLIIPAVIIAVFAGMGTGINGLMAGWNEGQYIEMANQPVGIAKGVIPGRVIWAWDPDAVNEECPNTWLEYDNWWMEKNTDRTRVHAMLESSLCLLTGSDQASDSWDKIFRYYNNANGKGNVPYQEGEKVCIKSNFVSCDATNMDGHNKKENLNMIDASPQVMWSVLNQLVNVCGIPQPDICIGDPSAYFPNQYYDLLKTDFPNVVYISLMGGAEGRTQVISSAEEVLQFSDGSGGDYLPVQFTEADYMINISVTKHHGSAGFTQIAKNHYGSNMRNTAEHMHSSLVNVSKGEGKYRHFVDLLGHKDLGGKTILNIGDFLWSGHDAWTTPVKYNAAPFLGDYPSSLLVSIDPLAVESVGMDFVQTQTWSDKLATSRGVDDYLYQAADSTFWPDGIQYDPENDGTLLESLGVFEHWNNDEDKQYSGNLGMPGGIELVMAVLNKGIVSPTDFSAEYDEGTGTITLSWTDLSEGEEAYVIERSDDGGSNYSALIQTGPDETTYVDDGVEPGINYYYRIKTSAGGVSTLAASVTVLAASTTGNRQFREEKFTVNLFPNPASDIVYISTPPGETVTGIRFLDMDGKLNLQAELNVEHENGLYSYDCSKLLPGNYLIRVDTENFTWTGRIVIVK